MLALQNYLIEGGPAMVVTRQQSHEAVVLVAGVASDGERTLFLGGWTTARLRTKYLVLADVWEYHCSEGCWIQVCFPYMAHPLFLLFLFLKCLAIMGGVHTLHSGHLLLSSLPA